MPNVYKIVRQFFFDDLQGEKRTCWDIEILQDDEKGYAYGVLKHHARFIRKSTIAENGTVCHDTILKVK